MIHYFLFVFFFSIFERKLGSIRRFLQLLINATFLLNVLLNCVCILDVLSRNF